MRMKPVSLIAAGGAALFLACSGAEAADRALVVGVNSYPHLTENGTPTNRDLLVAVQDAEKFNTLLTDVWHMDPGNIKMLTDADATRENILAAFDDWLVEGSEPGDRVVFYFSGHGFQSLDEDGDEVGDRFDEGLAPHNTSGDLADGKLDNIVIDDEVGELIGRLAGRDVYIVVDACFSGTITRSAALNPAARTDTVRARTLSPAGPVRPSTRSIISGTEEVRDHKVNSRLIQVLEDDTTQADSDGSLFAFTATTSAQLAFETSDIGGVFTAAMFEGLAEKAADFDGDGQVTAAELLAFARKKSDEFCESEPMCSNGAGLTPELITDRENFTTVLAPPLFSNLNTVVVAEVEPEATPAAAEQSGGEAAAETPAVVEAVVEAPPATTASGLFSHENDYEIGLSILPGPKLTHGQRVEFKVTSAEPGYLVLFDQSPDGKLVQIFPNEYSLANNKDGLINAGETILLPDPSYGFEFQATEYGESVLLALVVDDHVEFGDILTANPDFDIIADPTVFLSHIAERLLAPAVTPDPDVPNGRHHWAFTSLKYTVE